MDEKREQGGSVGRRREKKKNNSKEKDEGKATDEEERQREQGRGFEGVGAEVQRWVEVRNANLSQHSTYQN